MANPRTGNQNGFAPQYGQDQYVQPDVLHQPGHPQPQQQNQSRPFTLNEALPYTPFTSVFPFESGIINNPTIGSGQITSSVAGLVSHEDYDSLNHEAENPHQSKRIEASLEYVQNLLKPEKITFLRYADTPADLVVSEFKTAPTVSGLRRDPSKSLADGLPSFAKLVYENSNVSFRFPNLGTPKAAPNGQNMSPKTTKRSPKIRKNDSPNVLKNNPMAVNAQATSRNMSRIEVHLPSKRDLEAAASLYNSPITDAQGRTPASSHITQANAIQPQTVSPADLMVAPQPLSKPSPLVSTQPASAKAARHASSQPVTQTTPEFVTQTPSENVPNAISQASAGTSSASVPPEQRLGEISIELPASFSKNEFVVVNDSYEAPAHLSVKKRKRTELEDNEDLLDGSLNNSQRAKASLDDLQRCLQEIFDAEDRISRQGGTSNSWISLTPDQQSTMTIAACNRVQKLISKTLELGCYRLIPVEDLIRIQSLCDGSLKHAEGLDLKIESTWEQVEVDMFLQQLNDVEAGLKAVRVALSVMCGGRGEKQLYSEDLIQLGLNLFKNVIDGIVVPVAELRSSGATTNLFKLLSAHKKAISTIFTACQKLFALMSSLITSVDLSETVVNTLEFVSSRLVFVENAHTEKDSVVGAQKFDGLRLVAMGMVSQVFLMNTSQRQGIFDDILTSLEKLPVSKLSARQFKLADGGSIQPVSALVMRLVQASAGKIDDSKARSHGNIMLSLESDDQNEALTSGEMNGVTGSSYRVRTEDDAAIQHSTAIQELDALSRPLFENARQNAWYVIKFMVTRAQKTTKSSTDSPYRKLLDLFVEDFTTCLDSPDWPAAELLLRLLMSMMLELINSPKTAAPAKNMALELLGVMAASISKLRSHVRKIASSFEGSDTDEYGQWLADLTSSALDRQFSPDKVTSWLGPFRIVLEFLEERVRDDPHLNSAISYVVTDWAIASCNAYDEGSSEDSDERDAEYGRIAYRLRRMVDDRRWLTNEYSFKAVAANHAKLSYSILMLRSQFCDAFRGILNILMQSVTTDAATSRSRSLKSINQVLETDPSILDGDSVVVQLILQCSNDTSAQVRDSALDLIGKCINMRPKLEDTMTKTVIQRFSDSGVGVRKRAMKLAKDIYLHNKSREVRSDIANGLLYRTQDPDEGVRELAKQMIEDVWISPFYKANDSTAYKQSLTDHVALMVQTVKQGNASFILEKVLQTILSSGSKPSDANSQVCARLVANMFDLVDNPETDDPSVPSGKDALQVLMIFAKADPKLFHFEQIRHLKPRIATVGSSEDVAGSRAVVVIYCRVLPQISNIHKEFLQQVAADLLPATSRIARGLLDDVMACLWTISGLTGSSDRLARLVCSGIAAIQKLRVVATQKGLQEMQVKQLQRYCLIVGMAGKHCNLDSHAELFREKFNKWKGNSVSKLMVDVIVPLASLDHTMGVRKPALDAVGLICQANPNNYIAANVYTAFQQVFDEGTPALESIILRSFKEFLFKEEKRSEQATATGNGSKEPVKKDLKVMGSTGFDDVSSATTQRFLKDITRITMATQDEHAFLAMEVLASINRQGLVHPKETGVTLITLETCPITKISELAYHEHRVLHEKHETVLEREYVKAVQSAFQYQRDVIKDSHGATTNPFTSKLHMLVDVLNKTSKAKNRQRFLERFIGQIDFDPSKLEADSNSSTHVEFSRFLIENIAFFEYASIVELQFAVNAMEKIVTSTGSSLAQSIESEVFQVRVDIMLGTQQPVDGEAQTAPPAETQVGDKRLRQLTAGSMVLLMLWDARTHLRRLYGLSATKREHKSKVTKDLTKAPSKVPSATGDKFWEDVTARMTGMESKERMMETCRAFVELLNVDNEVKIAEEEEEELDVDLDGEARTPDGEEDDDEMPNSEARGRKRKAGTTPGGRKKRARSDSKPRPRGRPRKNPLPVEAEPDLLDDGEYF